MPGSTTRKATRLNSGNRVAGEPGLPDLQEFDPLEPRHVIDTITDALRAEPAVRALFLSGSHGNGLADQYSDIDFLLIAHEGPSDRIAQLWHDAVALTGDIVLWWDRNVRPALINAITDDWTRTDVVILKPDQMAFQAQDMLKPLIDHDGVFEQLPKTLPKSGPGPERLRYQIEEFIRVLGLLHLGLGREEHINGVLGVFHLRNLLVDLMITETGTSHRGGMLHLNRLIT